jgi:alkylated DNA repair dioxygenase AlkB
MAATLSLFPPELPRGFLYREEFLSEAEESDLLRMFRGLEFAPYDFHGFLAKRRIVRYGANYHVNSRKQNASAPPIPEFLLGIRTRAAAVAEVRADELVQALVSEYSVGTPIGWHRDTAQFGTIIGISLGSACRMRLKPYQAPGQIVSVHLEPRSIYIMKGEARSAWQHSIPAVEKLRYSITFRTLRAERKALAE